MVGNHLRAAGCCVQVRTSSASRMSFLEERSSETSMLISESLEEGGGGWWAEGRWWGNGCEEKGKICRTHFHDPCGNGFQDASFIYYNFNCMACTTRSSYTWPILS